MSTTVDLDNKCVYYYSNYTIIILIITMIFIRIGIIYSMILSLSFDCFNNINMVFMPNKVNYV